MVLCITCLFSTVFPLFAGAATGTATANSGQRETPCTALSPQALRYYSGSYSYDRLSMLKGTDAPTDSLAVTQQQDSLYQALHALMSETHEVYPDYSGYTENSLATYWLKTDAEAGSSTYLFFYTDILSDSISTTMNREHVWPKANASYSQKNGGADLHHLRPSIKAVNSAKSDHYFADIADDAYGMTTTNISGQPVLQVLKSASQVEVNDHIKGDVARILLYVYCRWEQPNLYSDVASADLPAMDSDDSTNNGTRAIADRDTLLRWCALDPVDEWEMQRNDQTENIQGNRNVFIDYPEFAWLMFGLTPPEDMITPSGEKEYEITVTVNDSRWGSAVLGDGIISASPAEGCSLVGYELLEGSADVTQDGNCFILSPQSDCVIQINFAPLNQYMLQFNAADPISGYSGDTVVLPSALNTPENYRFLGWVTESVSPTTQVPEYYPAGSSYCLSKDESFLALYSYEELTAVSDGDYVKLTQEPTDWNGEYLVVYEPNSYVLNASLSNPNVFGNYRSVTISNGSISAAQGDSYSVSIRLQNEAYSLRLASGSYIGNTSGYSGLAYSSSDSYSNKLQWNSDGSVSILSDSGAVLGFHSTFRKFQFFAGSTGNAVSLYGKATHRQTSFYTTELPKECEHPQVTILHSLNLASDISINYVIPASQLEDYSSVVLHCSIPEYSGNTLTGYETQLLSPTQNGAYYYFTLTGIAAISMSDEIQAVLHMECGDTTHLSEEDCYSISAYAYSQLDKAGSPQKLKALCADLLRYGSYAQIYKQYRTDCLADSEMTEVQQAYLSDLESVSFDSVNRLLDDCPSPQIPWVGKSLDLGTKVILRFVINAADYAGNPEELSLRISYESYDGQIETLTLTEFSPYGDSFPGYYVFDFDALLAAELRTEVSAAVFAGDTQLSQTMQYSVSSYGNGKTGDLLQLCKALMAYSDSALAQFTA